MVKCTKFDSSMQVIYIDKEKEWTKDRSMWDILCNSGIEEDEMHFLASCSIYKHLQDRYFGNIHENEYRNLLECSDKDTALKIANYIMKTMKLRKYTISPPYQILRSFHLKLLSL